MKSFVRSTWDDIQLGLKLGFNIEKIAIYGDKNWQDLASKIGRWFIAGDMASFGNYQMPLNG